MTPCRSDLRGSGETKSPDVKWEVSPSVAPSGASVSLHVLGGFYLTEAVAEVALTPEQAFDLATQLFQAAEWCKRKGAA